MIKQSKLEIIKNKNQQFLIIGAGGIGGITAAHMKRAGYNIEVVDNLPGLSDKIMNQRIHIFGDTEEFTITMPAYSNLQDVKGEKDVILIATKTNALCQIANEIENGKRRISQSNFDLSFFNQFS